jgi:hypothetical protein
MSVRIVAPPDERNSGRFGSREIRYAAASVHVPLGSFSVAMPYSPRRFPPPWSVEELDACFVVRDHDGFRILAGRDSAGVRLITREVCMSDPARVQGLVPEPPDDPQPLWPPR